MSLGGVEDRVGASASPRATTRTKRVGSCRTKFEPVVTLYSRRTGVPPWPGFRRTATTDWLEPLETGMRSIGRPELATVVLAVIRGLLMDLDATGDTERTDEAFRAFLTTLPRSDDQSGDDG